MAGNRCWTSQAKAIAYRENLQSWRYDPPGGPAEGRDEERAEADAFWSDFHARKLPFKQFSWPPEVTVILRRATGRKGTPSHRRGQGHARHLDDAGKSARELSRCFRARQCGSAALVIAIPIDMAVGAADQRNVPRRPISSHSAILRGRLKIHAKRWFDDFADIGELACYTMRDGIGTFRETMSSTHTP